MTAWVRKHKIPLIILALVFAVILSLFIWSRLALAPSQPGRILKLQDTTFRLEEASEAGERQTGLSGREYLPKDAAMLFVFDDPGQHCIWMKDMRFALDIIWLDRDKRIVHIKENASPASYPERFCPEQSAQYVLEFNAGTAAEHNLAPGQQLDF